MSREPNEESGSLRKTSLNSPPLLSVPHPPARKLSSNNFNIPKSLLSSRRTDFHIESEDPSILQEEKYAKLYNKILQDVSKTSKHLAVQDYDKQKNRVKQSISKAIWFDSEEGDFGERFSLKQSRLRKGRAQGLKKPETVGFTHLEKQTDKRKSFFKDHKKAIELGDECLLLEYYLKDEEKQKAELTYMKNLQQTSRHRRITPTTKQNYQLYGTHDEREYHSLKKRVNYKEQFVQKCSKFARRNSSYRRRQNFKEMQFVQNEHKRSLMEEGATIECSQEQIMKINKNNKLIRLYLRYKFFPIELKVNEDETNMKLRKFKTDLFRLSASFEFKQAQIDMKLEDIFKYKHQRTVHFHDFKEIVYFLDKLYGKEMISLFEEHFPGYFINQQQKIIDQNWADIDKHFSANKVKFLLQVLFRTFPDKMVGGILVPIKVIPNIFKAYGISEKDFDLNQLLITYSWLQHYDAGLTFEQFFKGTILLKMKKDDWRGVDAFVKKINIRRYI